MKGVSLCEEHVHQFVEGFALMPECLVIEAMAQTAGILVGQASGFKQKVILAKIRRARFHEMVLPGELIAFDATLESYSPEAASTQGVVTRGRQLVANIDLIFSHIDQNLSGIRFPDENFVFGRGPLQSMLDNIVAMCTESQAVDGSR